MVTIRIDRHVYTATCDRPRCIYNAAAGTGPEIMDWARDHSCQMATDSVVDWLAHRTEEQEMTIITWRVAGTVSWSDGAWTHTRQIPSFDVSGVTNRTMALQVARDIVNPFGLLTVSLTVSPKDDLDHAKVRNAMIMAGYGPGFAMNVPASRLVDYYDDPDVHRNYHMI